MELNEELRFIFHVEKNYKMIKDQVKNDLYHLLLERSGQKSKIDYYTIDLQCFQKTKPILESIELEILTRENESLLENTAIASELFQSFLIIFFESILYYVDLKSKKNIFKIDFYKQELNQEYFLSPTNLFTNKLRSIKAIPCSHNLLALDNLSSMLLIRYETKKNH